MIHTLSPWHEHECFMNYQLCITNVLFCCFLSAPVLRIKPVVCLSHNSLVCWSLSLSLCSSLSLSLSLSVSVCGGSGCMGAVLGGWTIYSSSILDECTKSWGAAEWLPPGGREPQKSQGTQGSLSPDFFHHNRKNKFMKYT